MADVARNVTSTLGGLLGAGGFNAVLRSEHPLVWITGCVVLLLVALKLTAPTLVRSAADLYDQWSLARHRHQVRKERVKRALADATDDKALNELDESLTQRQQQK